jgi:hemerythrin
MNTREETVLVLNWNDGPTDEQITVNIHSDLEVSLDQNNDSQWTAIEEEVIVQCIRKVAVHLQTELEVMSTIVYTGLNPFNFIHKTLSADLHLESRCSLIKGVGSDVHERLYRPEPI